MKLYGSLRELVAAVFRKDTKEITLEPNAGTYSGAVNIKLPPVLTGSDVLVSEAGSQSLTNKTIDADLNTVSNIDDGNIKAGAGIDASKIGAGSVDNTEFGYLNGVTSSIQTQLGGKAASGANSDITSLSGLTTALSTSQGGTGVNSTATFPSSGVVVTEAGSATLTNKTIDGDNNTVQDLGLSSLKTVLADANKAILRDAAGAVTSALIANANISPTAAIDASKIGAGSVDNTEFGYLNGVTSSIQTQLGSKAASGANSDITSLSGLTTALSISQGGTGQTSASAAINALLPSQATNFNKYLKTDGTNVSWASASGGAGEINAVLNASGADGTSGWINGTSHSINTVTGATIPLSPAVPTAFTMSSSAAVAIGSQTSSSGDYYEFTMPPALRNRKLKFEFYYTTPAAADGTWGVAVYNGATKVRLSTDTGATPDTVLPAGVSGGKFTAYFDTDSGTTYRVNFVQRTRTNTNSLWVTNVVVGPGIQPQGAVVGEWVNFTPAGAAPANTTLDLAKYRRVGDSAEISVSYNLTGAANNVTWPSSAFRPAGLTFDTTKIVSYGTDRAPVGTLNYFDTGVANIQGILEYVVGGQNFVASYIPSTPTASNGDKIAVTFKLPIAEWAGSGTVQLAQNDVEYAFNTTLTTTTETTGFGYGPAGIGFQAFAPTGTGSVDKRVRFQTPIQSSDVITVEIMDPTTNFWAPAASRFHTVFSSNDAGTTFYGTDVNDVSGSNTDIDVRFFSRSADKLNPWGVLAANGWKWRVRKSSAGAAVGFGIVSGQSAGLLPASNSNLDDATATRLGLKQYLHGTTYNGGIAPTVTLGAGGGTLSSVDLASFVPYQTQDGSWRLKFNIAVTVSSAARTLAALDVVGISVGTLQAAYGLSSSSPLLATSYVSGARFQIDHSSTTTTKYYFSGEAALSSKPTWAY